MLVHQRRKGSGLLKWLVLKRELSAVVLLDMRGHSFIVLLELGYAVYSSYLFLCA